MIYDAIPVGVDTHPMVIELFDYAADLRLHVEDVIVGATLIHEVPRLSQLRSYSAFAKVIEISAERLHAQLHRNIILALHQSGAFASVMERKPEIVGELQASPARAEAFADKLAEVRTAPLAIARLGLKEHPRIVQVCEEGTLFQQTSRIN